MFRLFIIGTLKLKVVIRFLGWHDFSSFWRKTEQIEDKGLYVSNITLKTSLLAKSMPAF